MDSIPRWRSKDEAPLTAESLRAVCDNEIPVVRIRNFCTAAECAAFIDAMQYAEMKTYSLAPVGYIGTAQVEYRWGHQKADYFVAAEQAWEQWHKVVDRSWNPLERLMDRLRAATQKPVGIAAEPGHGRLFAGIIRKATKGVARHVDWAPVNTPDYDIRRINAQLGWNVFFGAAKAGGETTVWNKPWQVDLKPGEAPPMSYGLDDSVVGAAEFTRYAPAAGEVVIFNSRNPHAVAPSVEDGTDRLQLGSFIGRLPDGSFTLWS